MRVSLVHSFYSSAQPSGENAVVRAEFEALKSAGVDVTLVRTDTDERSRERAYSIRAGFKVASGRGSSPISELAQSRPDVVHVHNLFPNWGDRWVEDVAAPLVHTLHNYRPMCAAGTFYRDGEVCTLCADGDTRPAMRHACYRDSRLATLPLAVHNRGGARTNRLLLRADRIIALSARMRDRYARGGVEAERLRVWPNFLPARLDPGPSRDLEGRNTDRYLFVGRLSEEKGVDRLVQVWPHDGPTLEILGDGPLLAHLQQEAVAKPSVKVHGRQPREAVLHAMASCSALVIPSRWFEGFPVIYAEALAAGLPVLTFEPCNVVELIREDQTGAVLTWAEPLVDQLPDAATLRTWAKLSREVYEAKYTEKAYVARAMGLYEELVT